MGLYNFKKRFVPFIESGEKTHTIRAKRKYPSKAGDMLYLYEGLRTKRARRILLTKCVRVDDIEIFVTGWNKRIPEPKAVIWIGGLKLSEDEIEAFAQRDGFESFADMMKFWQDDRREFPLRGDVIHWRFPGI
jgi:hypothetical protein